MVRPSPQFWAGRRVLITGHTGFKGAWLAIWLRRLGAKVVGLSLPALQPSLFDDAGLEGLVESRYADIRDIHAVTETIQAAQPEIVLHLAAQSLVRLSYAEPVETYATNVMGTVHVLAACGIARSVRSVLIVTSDKSYKNREWLWAYRENDALGGHDPYSSSKACAELVTDAWRDSFALTADRGIGIASARAGNVIGGGDWAADRLLPDCMRALRDDRAIGIRNPASTRPWQHVLDPLCGYLVLVERLTEDSRTFGEAWNFGPLAEDIRPVAWVADRVVKAWGGNASWSRIGSDMLHEARALQVDASKARARLGWTQALRLDVGIDWTVEWYRRFLCGESALALAEEQIARFDELSAGHA